MFEAARSIVSCTRIALLALLFVGAGCSDDQANETPPILGTVERPRIDVSAPLAERLTGVSVRVGERVTAGAPLATLDTTLIDARIATLDARIAASRAQLREFVRGPRSQNIDEARARLGAAAARLSREEVELRRVSALLAKRLISRTLVDDARLRRDGATQTVKETRAQLQLLLAGTRVEQLDRAEAELHASEAERARAVAERAQLVLVAPRPGIVEALPYRVGERPPPGGPIVQLLASDDAYARVYVPTAARPLLTLGREVDLRVEGVAEPLRGRVRFVAAEASYTPYFALTQRDRGHLVYLTEIGLPASVGIPVGTPVEVQPPGPVP